MNRWLYCCVLVLSAWLASRPARAADAPTITVTVRDSGVAKVTANGFPAGSICSLDPIGIGRECSACAPNAHAAIAQCKQDTDATKVKECERAATAAKSACVSGACAQAGGYSERTFGAASSGANVIVDEAVLTDDSSKLVNALLQQGAAWCWSPGQEQSTSVPVTIPASKGVLFPLSSTAGAWRAFDNANRFAWLGWDRPAFTRVLEEQLKTTWTCEFYPTSQPATACRLTRAAGPRGGVKLLFDADRPLSRDSTISVKSGTTTLITVSLDQCTYTAKSGSDSGLDALYADTDEERLEVASSPTCLSQLQTVAAVSLVSGNMTIQAVAEGDTKAGERHVYLRTGKVPADIPLGIQELELRIAQSVLGTLRVQVRPPGVRAPEDPNHHAVLSVSYGSSELDAWQSGRGVDGLAVVTPAETDDEYAVYNRVSLNVDSSLQGLGERLSPGGVEEHQACQKLWIATDSKWYAREENGALGVVALDPTDPDQFCVKGAMQAQRPSAAEPAELAGCEALALEDKVDVCRDALDEGAVFLDPTQLQQLDGFRNRRAWRLTEASWGGDLWFDDDWLTRAEIRLVDLSRVGFAVYQPQTERLTAKAELRNREGALLFRSSVTLADGARRESLPLALAGALQIECGSDLPPTPVGPNPRFGPPPALARKSGAGATATVPRDVLRNGAVRAVFDEDLDSGSCKLVYSSRAMSDFLRREKKSSSPLDSAIGGGDPTAGTDGCQQDDEALNKGLETAAATKRAVCAERAKTERQRCDARRLDKNTCDEAAQRRQDACSAAVDSDEAARKREIVKMRATCHLLTLYGPQLVEVVLTRGSEPSITKSWALDPGAPSSLPLPGLKPRAGDYTVVAHLKGPGPLGVAYRPSPQQVSVAPGSGSDLSTDFEFRALMRPRGLGSFFKNWRAFVTFPVRFTGLRFPAKSSTLASSSDTTAVQIAGVRAGVLGVLEPWNYDTRQNRGIVPWRLATGFNLYDLGTGQFDPAFLAGASLTLPVLPIDGTPSARNLNSSLALGAFWEVDLQRHHPLKDGHHFLLTFGLDLASLLSE